MKLALIVPYRDRPDHLGEFIPHYTRLLPDAKIVIVEQSDGKPFNRGKLLNIGFLETEADYYCFHDIDMLAENVNFSYPNQPTQLASSFIQLRGYFGGATLFNKKDFLHCGGYSNNFFSRAEDNELYFQVLRSRLKVVYRIGKFRELKHDRPRIEFDKKLWEKALQVRDQNDGLNYCDYKILSTRHGKFKQITVDI